MQDRTNNLFDAIVNKGLVISKFRGTKQAKQMMMKAGLPIKVIDRILFAPQKHRSSDWH